MIMLKHHQITFCLCSFSCYQLH